MLYNREIFKRSFNYKGKYFPENFKRIPYYFKSVCDLIRQGYDNFAVWEFRTWFPRTICAILKDYRKSHHGYPILSEDYPLTSKPTPEEKTAQELNNAQWDAIIDRMIELLADMDEENPKYSQKEYYGNQKKIDDEMVKAKDEFFRLLSEHFYDLWD